MSKRFEGHGYCEHPSYFVTREESFRIQGDEEGTAHPNAPGHQAFARILEDKVVLDPTPAHAQVRVAVDAVKITSAGGKGVLQMTQQRNQVFGSSPDMRTVTVPATGTWQPVDPKLGTFDLSVFGAPAPPRRPVQADLNLGVLRNTQNSTTLAAAKPPGGGGGNGGGSFSLGALPIQSVYPTYGAGTHIVEHPSGQWAVRYTIRVFRATVTHLDDPVVGRRPDARR